MFQSINICLVLCHYIFICLNVVYYILYYICSTFKPVSHQDYFGNSLAVYLQSCLKQTPPHVVIFIFVRPCVHLQHTVCGLCYYVVMVIQIDLLCIITPVAGWHAVNMISLAVCFTVAVYTFDIDFSLFNYVQCSYIQYVSFILYYTCNAHQLWWFVMQYDYVVYVVSLYNS